MKRVRSEPERTDGSIIMMLGGAWLWGDVLWCDSMRILWVVFCIGYELIGSIEEVSFTPLLCSGMQSKYSGEEHGYRTDANGCEVSDVMNLKCAGSGVGFGL